MERAARVGGSHRNARLRDQIAGIDALVNVVHRDPGGRSIEYRPDIGVPTAIPRQIGGVEVNAAMAEQLEQLQLEHIAEPGRDADLRLRATDSVEKMTIAEFRSAPDPVCRQIDGLANLGCKALVGLGLDHEADNLILLLSKPFRDLPAAPVVHEEDDPHGSHPTLRERA